MDTGIASTIQYIILNRSKCPMTRNQVPDMDLWIPRIVLVLVVRPAPVMREGGLIEIHLDYRTLLLVTVNVGVDLLMVVFGHDNVWYGV